MTACCRKRQMWVGFNWHQLHTENIESVTQWMLGKKAKKQNKTLLPSVYYKDTVPPRKEDFVADHFSHNAPHRPYIHCVGQGKRKEKETGGEVSVRLQKPCWREQSSDKKLAGQSGIINEQCVMQRYTKLGESRGKSDTIKFMLLCCGDGAATVKTLRYHRAFAELPWDLLSSH